MPRLNNSKSTLFLSSKNITQVEGFEVVLDLVDHFMTFLGPEDVYLERLNKPHLGGQIGELFNLFEHSKVQSTKWSNQHSLQCNQV